MHARLILVLLVLVAPGFGCSVISSSSTTTRSGVEVPDETLAQVEPGKTTKKWLVATLGPPSSASTVGENTEILSYTATRIKKQRSGLLLVFNTRNEHEEKETVYFEFENGILKRYWKSAN